MSNIDNGAKSQGDVSTSPPKGDRHSWTVDEYCSLLTKMDRDGWLSMGDEFYRTHPTNPEYGPWLERTVSWMNKNHDPKTKFTVNGVYLAAYKLWGLHNNKGWDGIKESGMSIPRKLVTAYIDWTMKKVNTFNTRYKQKIKK